MIYDLRKNALLYKGISPQLDQALELVAGTGLGQLPPGKTHISDHLFINVMAYETKPQLEVFEAHRQYADIHVVLSGTETVAVAALDRLQAEKPYDTQKDCLLLRGPAASLNQVTDEHFILCFAGDAHITGLDANGQQSRVVKAVVKVKL